MSWLRESIVSHLERMIEELDSTELYLAEDTTTQDRFLKITDIAVEPVVVTQNLLPTSIKIGRDGKLVEEDLPKGDVLADLQAEIYERPFEAEKYVKESWSRIFTKEKSLVVKGEPGGGKTFITRHTAIEIAKESRYKLLNFTSFLEDIDIPIWVTANDLAEQFQNEKQSLAELLSDLVKKDHDDEKLIPAFYDWLQLQLENKDKWFARFTIFIDALDEIEGKNQELFEKVAAKLKAFKGRVVFTCRTMRWETQKFLTAWNKISVVSLDKFNDWQKEEVIGKFFQEKPHKRSELKRLMENNFSLQNSFSLPLMLTFGCLLHRIGELDEDTSQIQLYEKVIRNIFSGKFAPNQRQPFWTKNPNKDDKDQISPSLKKTMLIALFDEISLQLFVSNPESKEFSATDWNWAFNQAVKVLKDESNQKTFHPQIGDIVKHATFLTELEKIRLIIPTRKKNKSNKKEKEEEKWNYLHKTFLEFAAARALSNKANWLEEARKYLWNKYWLETLTFLAGQVEDVKPLISAVRQEESDIFGWKLFLEARFTGVSNLAGKDIEEICDSIICGLSQAYVDKNVFEYKPKKRRKVLQSQTIYEPFIRPAYSFLGLNSNCINYIFENFISKIINFIDNKKIPDHLKSEAVLFLGKYAKPSYKIREFIFEIVCNNQKGSLTLRLSATLALGEIARGDRHIISTLERIFHQENRYLRIFIARTLLKLGEANEEIIEVLFQELIRGNSKGNVFRSAILALGYFNYFDKTDKKVIKSLFRFIHNEQKELVLRQLVALALGELGEFDEMSLSLIIQIIQDKNLDPRLRGEATDILGEIGGISENYELLLKPIIDYLANGVMDEEESELLRSGFALSMFKIDKSLESKMQFVELLFQGLYHLDSCRLYGLKVLEELCNGNEGNIEILYRVFKNKKYNRQLKILVASVLVNLNKADKSILSFFASLIQNEKNAVFKAEAIKLMGKAGIIETSIINQLIQIIVKSKRNQNWYRSLSANSLSLIVSKKSDVIDPNLVQKVIKVLSNQLDSTELATPLFQIWQRTNKKNLILTWEMLDKIELPKEWEDLDAKE